MADILSVFDIPHVLERIGLYLSPKDRLSYALVNKYFHNEIHRLFWRDLVFQRRKPCLEAAEDHPRMEALRCNTRWARKVVMDTQCRMGVAPLLAESCRSLRELSVYVSRSQQDDPDGDQFLPVVDLATKNTKLQSFSLLSFAEIPNKVLVQFAGALSWSSCLTNLQMEFRVRPAPRGLINCVLFNLPRNLKYLSMAWGSPRSYDGIEMPPEYSWPESYPFLEVAKLTVELDEREEQGVLQFLQRCPALKDCTVPRMGTIRALDTLTHMLATRRLPFTLQRVDCRMWGELNEYHWNHLLQAMGGHIQSFVTSVNLNTIPTQHFVKDMVGCWSQTLESLTIYHAHLIASQDIQLILTSCPKLKKFNCFCYWLIHRMRYGTIRDLGLKATMIAEIGANDASRVDWVCTELEELKMTFADGRRDPEEGQSFPDQEQLVVQGMKEIYQQLGRLTKLKELLMGWYSPDRFSKDPNMDLSLESGLGYMSELKSLRKLDLAYFRRVNFGLEEAEWIRKNWPALETINGLKYRRIPGEDVDVPDYSSLLPWLCIS